jgi:AcrR family transcriptional regulator
VTEADPNESETLGDREADGRIHRVLAQELGESVAGSLARARRAQELWEGDRRRGEGLRERKKRLTRQRISDVATALFVVRGFDNVKVSEVAEIVGVSEKTIYNYFPTKESLVFDQADEGVERLVTALRNLAPGESPTRAVVRTLKDDLDQLEMVAAGTESIMPMFRAMIQSTPSLRAAWLEIHRRLVDVATEELSARVEVDPHDPEPMIAARALVGLQDVFFESIVHHVEGGVHGPELRELVEADIDRAARLLETGLWSFNLLAQGRRTRAQLRDAAIAADRARAQGIDTIRHARAAWRRELHDQDDVQRAARRRGRGRS